jgi:ketosteroid isomerase-like protein
MASEFETVVRGMFDAIDRNDLEEATKDFADDVQGVDEISRGWVRGRDHLNDYVGGLLSMVEDVRSEIRDLHEATLGETGQLLTFWLEQDYTLEGKRHHISAPTTVVFRLTPDGPKMVLFHSIPLPPSEEHQAA